MNKQQKHLLFQKWWDNLPQGRANEMKQKIMSGCYISDQVFRAWLSGRTEIPNIAMPVIKQITGEDVFNLKSTNKSQLKIEFANA